MSGYPASPRVDSAHDLSHGQSDVSYENVEVSQVVAASSVNPPWSKYNTRDQAEHISPYAPSESYGYTYFDRNRPAYNYDTSVVDGDTLLRYISPDAATQCSYATRTTASPLLRSLTAIESSSSPAVNCNGNNTVSCGQCGGVFTGTSRARNLSRHIGQQHENQNRFPCTAAGCSKVYKRQDARKKHIRNRHTEPRPPPVQRLHDTDQRSSASQAVEDIRIAQESNYHAEPVPEDDQHSSNHRTAKMRDDLYAPAEAKNLPRLACQIVEALKEKLTPSDRSRVWNAFFARWRYIVQQLWDDRSAAYPVYSQVMEDIRTTVQAVENTTDSFCAADPSGYKNRASKRQHTRPHVNAHSRSAHDTPITSPTDRISKHSGRKPSTGASGKGVLVDTEDLDETNKSKKVDCVVYKHHRMYGTTSTCSGFCASSMSQVRNHLNRGRGHEIFPECVQQCGHCKQEFVERQAYEEHISQVTCMSRPQFRGDKDVPWALLYLAHYPEAQRVPLPGHGDIGWLPASVVAECQELRGRPSASGAFSGERQDLSRPRPRTPTTGPDRSNETYNAAIHHALGNLVLPAPAQSAHHFTTHDQARPNSPTSPLPIPRMPRNEHLLEVLHDVGTLQRTLLRAAPYLSQEDMRTVVEQCTQVVEQCTQTAAYTGDYSDYKYPPSTHDEVPAIVCDGLSMENKNTMYMTPVRCQHHLSPGHDRGPFGTPDTSENGQFATPSTSQLPSNRSHETQFSLRFQLSTLSSSTTNEQGQQNFFAPTSGDDCSPVPLTPQDAQHSLGYVNWQSSPETRELYIDPTLLDQRGGDANASNSWSLPPKPADFNDPTLPSPWGAEADVDADDHDVMYGF